MTEVTIVGLGRLGLPVAAALAARGFTVRGIDSDTQRVAQAVVHGVHDAARDGSATGCRWWLSVLPDDAALEAVAGPGGALPAGAMHLCLGTIGLTLAQRLAQRHAAAGGCFIACPVFGRPDEAWARDLTALFGPGPGLSDDDRSTALALLGAVAPRIHRVTGPAAALATKLAGNLLIASAVATMSEALGLAMAHGAPPALVHEVLTGKLFKGPVYEGVGRALAACCAGAPASTTPGFTVRLGLKDLDLGLAAAALLPDAPPLPLAAAVRERLALAADRGHGERDWSDLPACLPRGQHD